MAILLDEKGIRRSLERLADCIVASVPRGCAAGIIGIRRRGDELARRLMRVLEARGLSGLSYGSLDITLYRDDLAEIGPSAVVRTTEIDFDITGVYLILVDDVIYTGRSVRAALQALIDLGRPKAVRLAVLVDRGGREYPIQPDFVGLRTSDDDQQVIVSLIETDGKDVVEARA